MLIFSQLSVLLTLIVFFLVRLIKPCAYDVTLRSLFKNEYRVSSIPNGDIKFPVLDPGCTSDISNKFWRLFLSGLPYSRLTTVLFH